MDNYLDIIDNQMNEIKNKLTEIKFYQNKKKKLIIYDKIYNILQNLNDDIDDFEDQNITDLELDNTLALRINENKSINKCIKIFMPYLLIYQLFNSNNF